MRPSRLHHISLYSAKLPNWMGLSAIYWRSKGTISTCKKTTVMIYNTGMHGKINQPLVVLQYWQLFASGPITPEMFFHKIHVHNFYCHFYMTREHKFKLICLNQAVYIPDQGYHHDSGEAGLCEAFIAQLHGKAVPALGIVSVLRSHCER